MSVKDFFFYTIGNPRDSHLFPDRELKVDKIKKKEKKKEERKKKREK